MARPERVLGQHALDGLLDDALGVLRHHARERDLLEATGIARCSGSTFLVSALLPVRRTLLGIDDDDEVTGVDVGRVLRLVLALENLRNLAGETAEHHVRRVDEQPLALDLAGLGVVGLQRSSNCLRPVFVRRHGARKRTLPF